ncbi:MAG: hypothetical protein WC899_02810 [bacterium]|jgi:hypothetical protein
MPWPPKDLLVQLAKLNFCSKSIKLPMNWQEPGDHYPQGFQAGEAAVPPNVPLNLFREESLNKYHVGSSKDIGKLFETYIEGICGAVHGAVDQWRQMAVISGVIIVGPVASVGMVVGPPLTPLIMAQGPKGTPKELKYTTAIANALGTAWFPWQSSIKVPGLPWYPAFAAFPGPVAPPMPNIPIPLIALVSVDASLSPGALSGLMMANLGDPTALHAKDLFDAISKAFNTVFTMFKGMTMVTNVLGTGPIPTFAPPFVPVGPVMGGVGTGPPGFLV